MSRRVQGLAAPRGLVGDPARDEGSVSGLKLSASLPEISPKRRSMQQTDESSVGTSTHTQVSPRLRNVGLVCKRTLFEHAEEELPLGSAPVRMGGLLAFGSPTRGGSCIREAQVCT